MRGVKKEINLYQYVDYRAFLRDWCAQARRGSSKSFSLRGFSRRAGFRSPNFFKLIMDGQRNLTEESLAKFLNGLRLNKEEGEFFRNLVFFTQAKTHDEKNLFYRRLLQSREFSRLKPLEKRQYEFYGTWYHPVIRELITSSEFDGTPEWLAHKVNPPILPAQAEKSLSLLEQLGLIEKTGPRGWRQTDALISTGAEVASLTVMNYHQHLLELSRLILPLIPADLRDISSLTLGISAGKIPLLKEKIRAFRKEIFKLISLEEHPDSVVLLNIQMFPATKIGGGS